MKKKTHIAAGIIATIPFITYDNVLLIPIAIAGSYAADWDFKLGIKHRTSTHSLLALLLSSLFFMSFNMQLGLLWGLNYATHLLLDSFTRMGVPLLYPYKKKCYGLKLYKMRR